MFVPCKPFQPSLIFVRLDNSLLCSTMRVDSLALPAHIRISKKVYYSQTLQLISPQHQGQKKSFILLIIGVSSDETVNLLCLFNYFSSIICILLQQNQTTKLKTLFNFNKKQLTLLVNSSAYLPWHLLIFFSFYHSRNRNFIHS